VWRQRFWIAATRRFSGVYHSITIPSTGTPSFPTTFQYGRALAQAPVRHAADGYADVIRMSLEISLNGGGLRSEVEKLHKDARMLRRSILPAEGAIDSVKKSARYETHCKRPIVEVKCSAWSR